MLWNIGDLIPGIVDHQLSQQAATTAYERTLHLQKDAQAFNSAEAQKNRDFQLELSNTAVQRRMADLQRSGINPLLAVASASSGASTPAGATASSGSHSVAPAKTGFITQMAQASIKGTAYLLGSLAKAFGG